MPPGEQRPIVLQYVAGSRRGPGASAITQEKESSRATRDEENALAKETGTGYLIDASPLCAQNKPYS